MLDLWVAYVALLDLCVAYVALRDLWVAYVALLDLCVANVALLDLCVAYVFLLDLWVAYVTLLDLIVILYNYFVKNYWLLFSFCNLFFKFVATRCSQPFYHQYCISTHLFIGNIKYYKEFILNIGVLWWMLHRSVICWLLLQPMRAQCCAAMSLFVSQRGEYTVYVTKGIVTVRTCTISPTAQHALSAQVSHINIRK